VELVEQQAAVLEKWCRLERNGANETRVHILHGGLKYPMSLPPKNILVTTADAFTILQESNRNNFGWDNFSLCIFDETHHVVKDHPYRNIAL
jgi:superfamily II DNA or RNA helicase